MALPATDNFSSGENPLATNWTTHLGGGLRSTLTVAKGITADVDNSAYWDADAFSNDQYAQVVAAAGSCGVLVRATGTGGTADGYGAQCVTGLATCKLFRFDDGTRVLLQDIGATFAANDVIRLEVTGATLKVFRNGAQVGTNQTDATYASGSAGVYMDGAGGDADDFEGGNLAADPSFRVPVTRPNAFAPGLAR